MELMFSGGRNRRTPCPKQSSEHYKGLLYYLSAGLCFNDYWFRYWNDIERCARLGDMVKAGFVWMINLKDLMCWQKRAFTKSICTSVLRFLFFWPGKLKYERTDRLHKSDCTKAALSFFPVKRCVYTFYSRQIKPKGSKVLRVMFLESIAFLFAMSPT